MSGKESSHAPPRLVVLSHELPPAGGGAGRNLALLCAELVRRGLCVEVWAAHPGAKRHCFPFGVKYFAAARGRRFETSILKMLLYLGGIVARAFSPERPAAVLSNMALPAGLAGALISRLWRVPHYIWHHGSDIHGGRPEGPRIAQRLLLRLVWPGAAGAFFVSPSLLAMARRLGHTGPARILPSFPDPAYARGGASAVRPEYLLFAGRLEPVKNPLLVVEAAALYRRDGGSRRVRIVGQGSLEAAIRRRIRDLGLEGMVSLEAPAAYAEMEELYRGAFALIVPSRAEGLCTSILEAASCGVPAVGADTVGTSDAVEHGGTGLLFRENDPPALAGALLRLEAEAGLRDALARRARESRRWNSPMEAAGIFLDGIPALQAGNPAA